MRGLMVLLVCMPLVATAGTTVDVDSMSVNGMQLQDIHCELTQGGLFASMAVAGEIASQKEAFDACAPAGAAVAMSWVWSGGATEQVHVRESTHASANDCMVTAMTAIQSQQSGSCRATLLVGDTPAGERAYVDMQGGERSVVVVPLAPSTDQPPKATETK